MAAALPILSQTMTGWGWVLRALRNIGSDGKIKVATSADGNRIGIDEIKKGIFW